MSSAKSLSYIWIIFNPISTGDSKKLAYEFARSLKKQKIDSKCIPTEYAGHAEILAKSLADKDPTCAIFSSSGDGAYNEVINGVLGSSNPGVITGTLPAGNANDHFQSLHRGNTVARILRTDIDSIDCIEVSFGRKKRYAHSYVGLGLTPQIGEQLNKHALSPVVELWIVLTKLFRIAPVKIKHNESVHSYDHLVISNIPKMSKYLTIASEAKVDDGLLEISTVRSGSLIRLFRHLIRRVIKNDAAPKQISEFSFTCMRRTKLQLDGEVIELKKDQRVRIRCAEKLLRTIV